MANQVLASHALAVPHAVEGGGGGVMEGGGSLDTRWCAPLRGRGCFAKQPVAVNVRLFVLFSSIFLISGLALTPPPHRTVSQTPLRFRVVSSKRHNTAQGTPLRHTTPHSPTPIKHSTSHQRRATTSTSCHHTQHISSTSCHQPVPQTQLAVHAARHDAAVGADVSNTRHPLPVPVPRRVQVTGHSTGVRVNRVHTVV